MNNCLMQRLSYNLIFCCKTQICDDSSFMDLKVYITHTGVKKIKRYKSLWRNSFSLFSWQQENVRTYFRSQFWNMRSPFNFYFLPTSSSSTNTFYSLNLCQNWLQKVVFTKENKNNRSWFNILFNKKPLY